MHAAPDSFIGREAELRRLRALLNDAREGCSGTVVVTGPAGQGKTALLDRLCADATGCHVVRATGVDGEAELPFATLDAALRPLLGRLVELPGAQRRALEGALALSDGGAVEPFAVGAGTLSLLAAAAEERPLLCVVDDLHWVDDASRRALLFAARRLDRESIAAVFALRPDELPASELRGLEQLPLPPLSGEESGRVLGDLSAGRLPGETAKQLIVAAAGNPLALHELAARLTPAQLAGREALVGPPPPSAGARELLAERLAALPERSARAVLAVTACEDADTGLLRRVLAAAGLELGDLVPAEERGLLQLNAHSVELRHPLVRSVAYHDASPEARRRAHAAVAAALEPGDARRPWHLAAAATEPDADVAAALEAQAAEMRLRGGHAAAGRARARAADMTPQRERRFARLLDAGSEFEFAGLYEESARMLGRARALADDPVGAARIDGVEASLLLRRGRPRDARGALIAQARALARRAPASSARFELQAAFASMALGEVGPWEEHARAGLGLVPDDDPRTRDVARAMLAAALIAGTRADEADPLLEQLRARLWDGTGDPIAGAVEVHALLARSLIWLERWDDAERLLARLEQDARRLGTIAGLPYVLNVRAILDGQRGRWRAAGAAVDEQLVLARDVGDELFLRSGSAVRAWIAALRGASDDCVASARAALDGAEELTLSVDVWGHYALALLALGRGEIDAALSELDHVKDRTGYPEPGSRVWEPDLIEALIRAGRNAEADQRLAAWEAAGERTGRAFALATAARCRGLLAPDEEIDAAFARALAEHERLPVPFQHARTLLCLGERLRRARRRADSRAPLRDALAAFERLGAEAWAARARTELRATGGMVPAAAARPELEELTPHEVHVALLVAEGRTNREVAAALFLAPKTIEHHLSTIYRKLGVKRRTELARLFAGSTR